MEKRIRKPLRAGYVCSTNSNSGSVTIQLPKKPHIRVFGNLMRISEMDVERVKNDFNVLYI
jgi:hypothetical protein